MQKLAGVCATVIAALFCTVLRYYRGRYQIMPQTKCVNIKIKRPSKRRNE
ncbi:MAG: hypothetical protein RR580_00645 [Christensenellaceae bacterium]